MVLSPSARRARWLVPLAILAVIGLTALLPTLSAADTPDLPPLTAQQLVEKVQQAKVDAFSGTIELSANLGIPNLSALRNGAPDTGFSPLDLLSGVHEADVRVDGPDRQSLVMRGDLSETAVYHDGRDVWTWQSVGSRVTHTTLPDRDADGGGTLAQPGTSPAPGSMPTPAELATHFLDAVTPTTVVSVATPEYVAGRAVYELVLAPRDAASTIDHVGIAVDAGNGTPLQVTVAAKGQTKPAVRLGFTAVDYSRPSGSFSFTPPPGANVNGALDEPQPRHRWRNDGAPDFIPSAGVAPADGPDTSTVVGESWTQVVVATNVRLPAGTGPLLRVTSPVSGPFGSGNLLETNLVNVLFLPDGRVAAGFVTPAALEAAVQP